MPKDLETIKKHRFFRKIDWQKLERRELEPPIKPLITNPGLAENFSVDFTKLSLPRPVGRDITMKDEMNDELFGGFSFVASQSVLESSAGW